MVNLRGLQIITALSDACDQSVAYCESDIDAIEATTSLSDADVQSDKRLISTLMFMVLSS